jgi:hypothetical protein
MTGLDVNTPRGQQTLTDEQKAVAIFSARHPEFMYVHTNKRTMAKADAMLVRDGALAGLVLTSCRYNCSVQTFELNWNWEWLVTWRKIALGAWLAKHLQTRLYGFLYVVMDDVLIIQKLFDPLKLPSERWLTPIRIEKTETQATVNGGIAWRSNAFIKIDKATQLRMQG